MKLNLPEGASLKTAVHKLEDSILVISGPALAVSGIIAGVDLLTGGHLLQQYAWFTLTWAITLMLTLDFQVLTLGVRAKRIYLSDKAGKRKAGEIVLAIAIAVAISYVSVQMQSIIARVNGVGISVEHATVQLGINPLALVWERSALVLFLIFLSGWFRDHEGDQDAIAPTNTTANTDQEAAIKTLSEQVQQLVMSVTQITTTVTEVKTTVTAFTQGEHLAIPERTEASEQARVIDEVLAHRDRNVIVANAESDQGDQDTNIGDRIKTALASNTALSDRELAARVGCSSSTANKWRRRIHQTATGGD